MSSPPYWGLRKYGVEGELGLERTPEEYVERMVAVFREVKRVLREDGTVWLNLGDSYSGSWGNSGHRPELDGTPSYQRTKSVEYWKRPGWDKRRERPASSHKHATLKAKDLVGIPWRVAFALQADGWWLRSDIIWAKPNPMPESVTDRPTRSHEYLFLLTRSKTYYYDADAVREQTGREATWGEYAGADGHQAPSGTLEQGVNVGFGAKKDSLTHPAGRNRRDVWFIATQSYKGAHFATFPEKLVEPCILAGSSHKACGRCGAPWARVVERAKHPDRDMEAQRQGAKENTGRDDGHVPGPSGMLDKTQTIGWRPTCEHNDDSGKCIVLDPFVGSGTTVRVAKRFGRIGVGIDLHRGYLEKQAKRRTSNLQLELVK